MAMMNEMEYRTIGSALAGGYRAAVYCRLSKDDDLQGESASIANQRDMLEKYCEKQGWEVVAVYQDDGFTGLNMERPDLQRMLRAIERRQINLVITKDLSRLGRNYLQTGHDGLCGNLCSPHRRHPGIFGYSLGIVRHDGLHGDSLLLTAQNGKSVQTDLRKSLNPGKSNERKRQQTTPFPGGGLAVLVINGLCNDSQRPFQSEEQGLSEPDETPASVYGVCSRHWRSVLFSYARYAGNQQCSGRHGASDAAGIFLCAV